MKKKKFSFPNWPPAPCARVGRLQFSEKVIFTNQVLQLNCYVVYFEFLEKLFFFYGVIVAWSEEKREENRTSFEVEGKMFFNLHEI